MLNASKYAQHFPDERRQFETPDAAASVDLGVAPSPTLLAALNRLEREFREILRAQSEHTDGSD
jgi:hypothetical protein